MILLHLKFIIIVMSLFVIFITLLLTSCSIILFLYFSIFTARFSVFVAYFSVFASRIDFSFISYLICLLCISFIIRLLIHIYDLAWYDYRIIKAILSHSICKFKIENLLLLSSFSFFSSKRSSLLFFTSLLSFRATLRKEINNFTIVEVQKCKNYKHNKLCK